ncbi:hypothetical protein [Paenibacillus pabuli]|uniref:hypothetical protein n=1 Tax=Paenibacillus pabuli TaxID=1472 RepID=UPI000780A57D|nr:hypothetical protein [Paenibacillus pabuli]MEC0126518.1 hypothetical protein [Paenibacillus pabuli]
MATKRIGGYSGTLQTGSVLRETELTSNVLRMAKGCHIGASFACHVVKGASFTLTARTEDIHYMVIMYKASSMEARMSIPIWLRLSDYLPIWLFAPKYMISILNG